ncbi:MAG: hypothetical protein M1823_003984 [Watsoniomyces obsoletus]|nr:MAG: hypothetical protein M1823_003984 [Watsoniomyces obsoletus]
MAQNHTRFHRMVYQWQEDVEDLEGYHPGGYHPVHLFDEYAGGRYRVVHKLGYGSFSTVWLARDAHRGRYVTLKITVALASKTGSESRILRHLHESPASSHPGKPYVSSLLDEFYIDGPNGRHLCLVFEPARGSVALSKEASLVWKFPMRTARAIAAQTILGVDYIHSHGVVHAGKLEVVPIDANARAGFPTPRSCVVLISIADLHTNNVLFKLPSLDSCSTTDELYQQLGPPLKTPVERMDGKPLGTEAPSYAVMPAFTIVPSDQVTSLSDARVQIADFGESFFFPDGTNEPAKTRRKLHSPLLLLPPEQFLPHDAPIGAPADIWTLASTIYESLGQRSLFEGVFPTESILLVEMVSTLGPFPDPWWKAWSKRDEFFHEDGSWKTEGKLRHDPISRPLLHRIHKMGRRDDSDFSEEEAACLERMLRGMMKYYPEERMTIKEVVASEWMRRWGWPALEMLQKQTS